MRARWHLHAICGIALAPDPEGWEKIFSQAISRLSPRRPKVASGSATIGGPSFLENGHIRNFSEAEGLSSTHNFEMARREIAGMM